jgi:hypothetical protein
MDLRLPGARCSLLAFISGLTLADVPWNFHERAPQEFDFESPQRALGTFLSLAQAGCGLVRVLALAI